MPSKKVKALLVKKKPTVKVAAKPSGPLCPKCHGAMRLDAEGIGWKSYRCNKCGIGITR